MRKLPEFTVDRLWEASRPWRSICWSKSSLKAFWRLAGAPRKFNALDVLSLAGARLSGDDAVRAACHMLPQGFRGFPSGELAYYGYRSMPARLQRDLREWQEADSPSC